MNHKNHRSVYPLLVIATAAILRSIPVVIAWPFPVGFDTNAYYLPEMLQGVPNLISVFRSAQLNLLILSSLYKWYPYPFVILNAVGIALQSGLGISLYLYCTKVVKLTPGLSFISSLAFITSILTFRLTWDQYRMSLGLIFALLTWATLSSKSQRMKFFSIPLVVLIIISNFLPALLFICTMMICIVTKCRSGALKFKLELLVTAIGSLLFALQNFVPYTEGGVQISSLMNYEVSDLPIIVVISGFAFFLFTCWMFIPSLIFVLRRAAIGYHTMWLCLIFAIALLGPLFDLRAVYSIWIYWMMPFPVAVFFGIFFKTTKYTRTKYVLLGCFVASLIITTTYVTSSPASPSPYFKLNLWETTGIPNGYLQSTVLIKDQSQLIQLLRDSILFVPSNSTILLPAQFYGLAILQANPHKIILKNIGEVDSSFGNDFIANISNPKSYHDYYLVWFNEQSHWYGVSSFVNDFRILITKGEFSLYEL